VTYGSHLQTNDLANPDRNRGKVSTEISQAKQHQFTHKGLANMFTSPKENTEWKSVNASEIKNQTSVNVNVNRSSNLVHNVRNANLNDVGISNNTQQSSNIKPKFVNEFTNNMGRVVDVRTTNSTVKKKK